MNLHEAMFTALLQDRADFAQLFLDNGVDLQHFLTVSRLRDLYADVSTFHIYHNLTSRPSGAFMGVSRYVI